VVYGSFLQASCVSVRCMCGLWYDDKLGLGSSYKTLGQSSGEKKGTRTKGTEKSGSKVLSCCVLDVDSRSWWVQLWHFFFVELLALLSLYIKQFHRAWCMRCLSLAQDVRRLTSFPIHCLSCSSRLKRFVNQNSDLSNASVKTC
jgi:hypothetical protein